MNDCIPVDQLGTLKQLSDDDPRRRHARSCPRCSSLLFAYDEFVRANQRPDASVDEAEADLGRFISTHIEGTSRETISGAPRRGRGRWFGLSSLKMSAALAAVIVMAVVLVRWQPWESRSIVYRGEAKAQLRGLSATRVSDGGIDLHWDAVTGADAYRVTILAQDLAEITRLEAGNVLAARLASGMSGAPAPYYWQVTALADGAEILTSDPQRLP